MKEFCISKSDAAGRMDKFCHRILKEAPTSFVYKMIRKKNITLNGKKAQGSEILKEGDVIRFFLSDETFERFSASGGAQIDLTIGEEVIGKYLRTVYEDQDVLIVNKPSGILSQRSRPDDLSMNEICLSYLAQKGEWDPDDAVSYRPSVCNRLDRNTSGLLIFAKTLPAARAVSSGLRDRSIHKYYACIVKGVITECEELNGYLVKNEATNTVYLTDEGEPGASPIRTYIEPVKNNGSLTLLKVLLITGRTHQIRLHLSSIGHPILGDPKYGDTELNRQYHLSFQLLHAYRMEMPDPVKELPALAGKVFEIPFPETFIKIMGE